ncbi:MAG: xanthine dehydrogenase family protein molybdopterin-binding subunit, partial [Ktedonobacteraceae bacterium]
MSQTVDQTKHNMVGKSTRRQDGQDKVLGRTRYAGDMPVAGLLHGRLVLSPYAHARIVNIDISAAQAVPGVKAVYTSETLGMAKRDSSDRSQAPLARDEVLWCGHPVAVVLAETEEAAADGVA